MRVRRLQFNRCRDQLINATLTVTKCDCVKIDGLAHARLYVYMCGRMQRLEWLCFRSYQITDDDFNVCWIKVKGNIRNVRLQKVFRRVKRVEIIVTLHQ